MVRKNIQQGKKFCWKIFCLIEKNVDQKIRWQQTNIGWKMFFFGWRKSLVGKKFGQNKFQVRKKIQSENFFWSENFVIKIFCWLKQILCEKFFGWNDLNPLLVRKIGFKLR